MIISAQDMAVLYWQRLRRASLKEVEQRLAQLRTGSPQTLKYWLEVHNHLERKSLQATKTFKKPPQQEAAKK